MSKVVLGKGLEALIPAESTKSRPDNKFRNVTLDRIAPNPMQPRREFDQKALSELSESLKRDGVMQPLLVRQDGSTYTIIAGERRYRAARIAGLDQVPVILMDNVDDTRMLQLALVENLQREDLNPMETAEAYRNLIDKCGLTQAQLAGQVGKSRTAVTNSMRLLSLPDSIKLMIRENRISEGHARAILALDSELAMLEMAQSIVDQTLSVRETEKRTRRPRGRRLIPKRKLPEIAEAESQLRHKLGTAVKIKHTLKGGKIEIEYYSDDDLTRILELF